MADADYGYVGTGPGKINLYKEKEVIKRNVPEDQAVDELIELIRSHGDWIDAHY
jgi:(E)-4-hydroxy-3-methylbut-2-enyl-diphosphate synthase